LNFGILLSLGRAAVTNCKFAVSYIHYYIVGMIRQYLSVT
jgi:hypothetical protein